MKAKTLKETMDKRAAVKKSTEEAVAKPAAKPTAASLKRDAAKKKLTNLQDKVARLERESAVIEQKIDAIKFPKLKGVAVMHKKFGEGKVAQQKDNHIVVKFAKDKKEFQLPGAIAMNYLTIEDSDVTQAYYDILACMNQRVTLADSLRVSSRELQALEA